MKGACALLDPLGLAALYVVSHEAHTWPGFVLLFVIGLLTSLAFIGYGYALRGLDR